MLNTIPIAVESQMVNEKYIENGVNKLQMRNQSELLAVSSLLPGPRLSDPDPRLVRTPNENTQFVDRLLGIIFEIIF